MNPENSQPLQPDYLDQIAPQNTSGHSFNSLPMPMRILAILLGIFIVVLVAAVIINLTNGSKNTDKLAARLLMTQTIVKDAADNNKIKSSALRAINTDLKTYLVNTIRDIEPILKKDNVDINKLPSTLLNTSADTSLAERLEDARLNAVFDQTYAREMAYSLNNILSLMQKSYKQTGNSALKTFLDESMKNLQPTQESFADFNAES
jgi:predicted outer membrane protein